MAATTTTQRTNRQYVRHTTYARIRHAKQFLAWLAGQATILSLTAGQVFDYMHDDGRTAHEIVQDLD